MLSSDSQQWGHSSVVERLLCMQEVWGSIPHVSIHFFVFVQDVRGRVALP